MIRRHITWANGWLVLGLVTLVLTALGVGTYGHDSWRGALLGMVFVIWARVEQHSGKVDRMERRYSALLARHEQLLERFLAVLSQKSDDDTDVPHE